jgi:hypothetical protein
MAASTLASSLSASLIGPSSSLPKSGACSTVHLEHRVRQQKFDGLTSHRCFAPDQVSEHSEDGENAEGACSFPATVERAGYRVRKLRWPERLFQEDESGVVICLALEFPVIARHDHHPETPSELPRLVCQFEPADPIRHYDVGQQRVDRLGAP